MPSQSSRTHDEPTKSGGWRATATAGARDPNAVRDVPDPAVRAMAKKQPKRWVWSPPSRASHSPPDAATRAQVEQKARELIENVLKLKHVQPPPGDPEFNYVIDLGTKWHGRSFYFVATYACPGPNAISPT